MLNRCRRPRIAEIRSTERNYVEFLELLADLKDNLNVRTGDKEQLLYLSQIEQIFKTIVPIYMLHVEIYNELERIMQEPNPSPAALAEVYINRQQDFMRVYLPFVNFFEDIKSIIAKLRREKPSFDKYIREFENDARCHRLRIGDLLIRPIQRIPSIILLMTAVLQYTRRNSQEYARMTKAVTVLKHVAEGINANKALHADRRTVLLIANGIEGCPPYSLEECFHHPTLCSSHRQFVREVTLVELSDCLIGQGTQIVLFVFADCLEFARLRSQSFFKSTLLGSSRAGASEATTKATSTLSLLSSNQPAGTKRKYKHLLFLLLVSIAKVHIFRGYKGNRDVLGITYDDRRVNRNAPSDKFQKLLIFNLTDGHGCTLEQFAHELTQLVLQARCLTKFDSIFVEENVGRKNITRSSTIVQRMKSQIHRGLSRVFSMQERRVIARQAASEARARKRPPPEPSSSDESDAENVPPK